MNLWRLECFVALAHELHFGRAAGRLYISQPALSQQVKRLEQELGVALVDRTGGVTLTAAGQLLFDEGVELLRTVSDLEVRVGGANPELKGELRILYNRSIGVGVGVEVLQEFRRENPEVEVSSQTMWTSWNVEALRDNLTDVAFVRLPLEDPSVVTQPLGSDSQMLAMPHGHPLTDVDVVKRESMPAVTMVPWIREDAPGAWDVVFGAWDPEVVTLAPAEPDVRRRLAMAEYLNAVTPIHEYMVHELPAGLTARPLEPPLTSDYGLAWARSTRNRAVQHFVNAARKWTGTPMPRKERS